MSEREGVLVAGTITQDFVDSPSAPLAGELGGSATYFALAARHFCPVGIVSVVGEDRAAEVKEALWFADLTQVTISDKPTQTWHARRDSPAADAVTLKSFGAIQEGNKPQISGVDSWPHVLFLASLDPVIQLEVARNARAGALVGGDTMDTFIRDRRQKVEKMVEAVRLLVINGSELEMLSRTRGIAAGAENLLMRFRALGAVIVKRGADGAVLITRGGSHRRRAYRTTVVDPTGAGDALAGAVMGRLVQRGRRLDQDSLLDALEWGLVAASFTVEQPGIAGIRDCSLDDMKARLEAYRLEVRPREPGQS